MAMNSRGNRKTPNAKGKLTVLPGEVLGNQPKGSGTQLLIELDGLLHEYSHDQELFVADRLVQKVRAEFGWFEKISKHGPSVGDFYEALLESVIREVMPKNYQLGNGFVYESASRNVSSQVDLIVYRDIGRAPIYKRGDFVVVDATQVISCIEVKKSLSTSALKDAIRSKLNDNFGTSPSGYRGVQYLNIFCFQSKVALGTLESAMRDVLKEFLAKFQIVEVDGSTSIFPIFHLTLPRVFFLDQSGFITTYLEPREDGRFDIGTGIYRSSSEGHSLGDFLAHVLASEKVPIAGEQRDFLSLPFYQFENRDVLLEGLALVAKLGMSEIASLFPVEISGIRGKSVNGRIPFAALVSASVQLGAIGSLAELERTKGFQWLSVSEAELGRKKKIV